MCQKENFIEQSIIDIFLDVFQDELCILSTREIEDLVKRAITEQGLHPIAIEGDMNYEVNIDPEQIAMWISFVADIVFLIKAFKKSKNNNINDNQRQLQIEENITEEVIEFERFLKNKGNRYIETKKYKKKITLIYKNMVRNSNRR